MNPKARTLEAVVMGAIIAIAIIGGVSFTTQSLFNSTSSPTSSSENASSDEIGLLAAQLTDPPNVQVGVSHVFLNYSDVMVHAAGVSNDSGWFTIANSGVVDLMSIVNESLTVGSANVSPGLFTLVRLDISNAWITYFGTNDSALVPENQIEVPITNGGIYVSPNGSSGLLIDISPTVVPFQNGTSTGFVIVPSATSLPISPGVWHKSLENPGATSPTNWLNDSDEATHVRNLAIFGASVLTPGSFEVSVRNNGNAATKLTSIAIMEAGEPPDSNQNQGGYGITIAVFQVLPNGSVVWPGGLEIKGSSDYSGYTLGAGQSITLSYNGPIATLALAGEPMSHVSTGIVPGTTYEIKVAASFGGSASTLVNATGS